jgi:hypothetical protein
MAPLRELQKRLVEEKIAEEVAEVSNAGKDDALTRVSKRVWASSLGRESTSLVLYLSNGGRLKASSFSEAAAHTEVSQNTATSFDLSMECGTISLEMSAESGLDTELTLQVSPSRDEAAKSLFYSLKQ